MYGKEKNGNGFLTQKNNSDAISLNVVQLIGNKPEAVHESDNREYRTGAFLMPVLEIIRLGKNFKKIMMLKKFIFFFALILAVVLPGGQLLAQLSKMIYQDAKKPLNERVDDLIKRLTLEEKATLFAGKDMWHFNGVERLGIPPIEMTDCGHGITVILDENGNYIGCATCFPTAVAQAATWNREIITELGSALGREARATGSTLLLAPMVNIHRSPLGGRNYEAFSEDPVLSGKMAAAFIKGVQSENIAACIKAIAANNQQTEQQGLIAEIPERALREIYMRTFEIAIKEANPWAVMTAYNGVNGFPSVENKHLVTDILRNEWNYKGFVVSDWRSVKSIASLYAGVDMEMPGPGKFMRQQDILNEIKSERLSEVNLNSKLKGLLRLFIQTRLLDFPKPSMASELNSATHQQLARKVSEESIVLLKNTHNLLPLKKENIKKLAVIGPNANEARLGGGGSASVTSCYSISPLEGLRNFCGNSVEVVFEQGCGLMGNMITIPSDFIQSEEGKPGLNADYFNNISVRGEPILSRIDPLIDFSWGWAAPGKGINKGNYSVRWTGTLSPPVSGKYKIGLAVFGAGARLYVDNKLVINAWGDVEKETFEDAFTQTKPQVELELEANKKYDIRIEWHKKINRNMIRLEWEMPGASSSIDKAVELAASSDAAIVFAGLSNFFEGGNNDKTSLALPGDQEELIRRVVAANPNTIVVLINGTPVTMPWLNKASSLLEAYYPGQEGGNALANVIFGKVNPSGKLPETFPMRIEDNPSFNNFPGTGKLVKYEEGIYVGYRHYDAHNIEPLFPFGHGLSYTEFDYSNLKILKKGDKINVQFLLKNSGQKLGKEAVQLYVRKLEGQLYSGYKELKNFDKIELSPGGSKSVSFELDEDDFSVFEESLNKWVKQSGKYEVLIGSSSRDIRLKGVTTVR